MRTVSSLLLRGAIHAYASAIMLTPITLGVELEQNQATQPPVNARYEVVQSSHQLSSTWKLDRYFGFVWQLTKSSQSGAAYWDIMLVRDLPSIAAQSIQPRIQIFISGIAENCTLLIDTETGASWQLVAVPDDKGDTLQGGKQFRLVWQPFEDNKTRADELPR